MDYIIRRIFYAIPIALGVTIIVFSLVYMGPVDPLTAVTPDDAEPEVIEMIKKQYGFDKPIPVQYLIWLKRALTGDFGVSLQSNRPVIDEVIPALRKTMMLAMVATGLAFSIAFVLGVLAAYHNGTWMDRIFEWTFELDTGVPNSYTLNRLPYYRMASPTAWKKAGSWVEFLKNPVGSGAFKVEEIVPRERAVLVPNKDYWNKDKIPKLDKMILIPIPDHNARAAALLSGDVDMIEVPPPDTIPRLEKAGMQIITNKYPHIWPWFLRVGGNKKTPLTDLRVRKAINLCVNRDGIVEMLNGYGVPAYGHVLPDSPWFGNPSFKISYDPDAARNLVKEAGYGPGNPVKFTMVISHGGSGQMQPLPMNEFIQQNLKDCNIEVDFEIMEWQAMRAVRNKGPFDPANDRYDGVNNSWGSSNAASGFETLFASWKIARGKGGVNWGVDDPVVDDLLKKVMVTFDTKAQDKILAKAHERIVDQAYWLWVAYDINVHAANPNVKGFVPEIAWSKDFTSIYIE